MVNIKANPFSISMKKISISLLCLFAATFSFGQQACTIRLTGLIESTVEHNELEGVHISFVGEGKTYKTDRQGKFVITNLCPDTYHIRIEHFGFLTKDTVVSVVQNLTLHLHLDVSPIHIEDVVITQNQSSSMTNSVHRITMAQREESRGKLLGEVLSSVSGVSTLATGSNIIKPVINGLHSTRVLILNNGVRQEGQQWGVEHAPEMDPFALDEIEVVKGAQGVRYGADALGGVVLTAPARIQYERQVAGRLDVIGNSNGQGLLTHARLEGGIHDKFGWRATISSRYSGNIKTAAYYLGNTGNRELNYSFLTEYNPSHRHTIQAYYSHFGTTLGIFEGAHIGSVEDILSRIEIGRPLDNYTFSYTIAAPRQRVEHDLLKLKWNSGLTDKSKMEVQYAFQQNRRQEFDLRRVQSDNTALADMVLTTQTLDAMYTVRHFTAGANGIVQVHNNTPGTGTTPIIPNFDSYTIGAFAIQQVHLDKFHIEMGMRYDYKYFDAAGYRYDFASQAEDGSLRQYLLQDTRHFHNVSGTVGVLYHVRPAFHIKSNIGMAWRAPSANELYSEGVHHGSATYEVGDKDLQSERGLKWINSFLVRQENLQATLDLYGQYIADYIYANPDAGTVRQTIRGTFPVFQYEQHNALFYGADLNLSYELCNNWQYGINVSLVRAKNMSLETYLPYIPADRIAQHVRYHFNDWKKFNNSYVQINHQLVASQDRYQANSDFVSPPPGYQLFGLTASTKLATNHDNQIGFMVQADNLLNTLYKDYMDRFRYYTHQMGRNISVKINYSF